VIDEEGTQLGVMPTPRALEMAQERGLDLVEVAPMAQPPVARFLDFGQYKYELTKREKEAKKRQRVGFKEVRLSPKIGSGDFETKLHRAIEFLEEGDRIKVTVRFRGRELTHPEIGRNLLTKFTEQIKDHGVVERAPLLEGKQMHLTVASLHKPKGQDAAPKAEQPRPEQPSAAQPKADQPRAAQPGAEQTAEQTKADQPRTAEPKADQPKADQPKAAAPAEPVATEPAPAAAAGATNGPAPAPAEKAAAKSTNSETKATDGAPAAAPARTTKPAPAPVTTGE
jgi:translation initiation factor IF-3